MTTTQPQFDQILFESELVRIGAFRCHPEHPSFQDSGPAENYCFVFPRTAVAIQHEHEPAFVANPNVVTFYNSGQSYRRSAISPEGDHCDWFGVDRGLVRDAVRAFHPWIDDVPDSPFQLTHGWTNASTYLLQRNLFAQVSAGAALDPLTIEETVVHLLDQVVRSAHTGSGLPPAAKVSAKQRAAVHDIETLLSMRPDQPVTLKHIAREVNLSEYYVCRLFRRVTRMRLHQYRLRFRLRVALSEVMESARPLTDIALDSGFCGHSHFTDCFRHEFGATPSRVRATRSRNG